MSNVIKSMFYQPQTDKRTIEFITMDAPVESYLTETQSDSEQKAEDTKRISDAKRISEQIIKDAEEVAEEQMRLALEESAKIRETAQLEIEDWWQRRREQDVQAAQEAREAGQRQGYEEGLSKAQLEVFSQYETMLSEARHILEDSNSIKDQIIHESEPFLIELSSSIAEKIIGKQLALEPEWMLDLVRRVLSRRKEKGAIALCVSPKHFDYIFNAREELLTSIDSQAELQILPDASVQDEGCVIRSAFGSIDARIDTQLKEIKSVLLQIAAAGEGDPE